MLNTTRALVLSALLSATGCMSPWVRPNSVSEEPWTNYAIGRTQDAPTGSTVVQWIGHAKFLRGYRMIAPLKVDRMGQQPPSDGSSWPARYIYSGPCPGGRFVITNARFYKEQIGIIVADDGTIPCEKSVFQIAGL